MLIEIRPDWNKLEAMYKPMSDHDYYVGHDEEERREIVADAFHEYAPRNLKIQSKGLFEAKGIPDGTLIPYQMNRPQLYLHWILQCQKQKTGRNRAILLKGRQWGGSTYVEAEYYWQTTSRPGCNTFIFSHEEKSTKTLFEMVARFHEHCDVEQKPTTGKTNAQELVFPVLDSRYEMATAGKKDAARSKRITLLHWSEMASSPNADGHKRGLLQTVPDSPGTSIIKESTANGVGNTFHSDWLEAIESDGWEEIAIFIPWFWHEEYQRNVPSDFRPTAEEEELSIQFGLSQGQLMFRRWKIRTMKGSVGNRDDAFKQEYPMDWHEAFLFSGSNRFKASDLKAAEEHLKPPIGVYSVDMSEKPYRMIANPHGELSVWEMPNRNERGLYGIGVDVAKGLEHGDDSVACGVNMKTGETAFEWSGKIPSHEFGDLLYFLGRWAGDRVEIAVETTGGYGDNTVKRLQRLHYSHLYYTERRNRDGSSERRVGFDTTKNSKPRLIDELDEDLIEEPHIIKSIKTWSQMGWFVRKFNSASPHQPPKLEAQDGKHDDHVIARALASLLYHRKTARPRTGKDKERKRKLTAKQHTAQHGQNLYRKFAYQTETAHFEKIPEKLTPEIIKELRAVVAYIKKDKPIRQFKHVQDSVAVKEPKRDGRRGGYIPGKLLGG